MVYLFGGSGAMECFTTETALAQEVAAAAGREVRVVSLAAHGQSFAQTLAVVDNLPEGEGLVAIGVTPMRLTVAPETDAGLLEGRIMPLVSPRLTSAMAREGFEDTPYVGVLPGVLDYISAYIKARGSGGALWLQSIDYYPHYWGAGPAHGEKLKKQEATDRIAEAKLLYPEHGGYNLRMLAEVTKLARERGYAVTWYEQPLNHEATRAVGDPTWGGVLPAAEQATEDLAAELDVPYLLLQQRTGVEDADFGDVYHLLLKGRLKWEPVMGKAFGRLLRDPGGVEPVQ